MTKFITTAVVVFFSLNLLSVGTSAATGIRTDQTKSFLPDLGPIYRDPGDGTFPLNFPLPFPWGTIEGIWETVETSNRMLFSFEVESDIHQRKFLRVVQIDTVTGDIVADGNGLSSPDDKQVSAGMYGPFITPYMVFVGLYEDRDALPRPPPYTALTIRPAFTNPDDPGVSYKIRLISRVPIRPTERPSR